MHSPFKHLNSVSLHNDDNDEGYVLIRVVDAKIFTITVIIIIQRLDDDILYSFLDFRMKTSQTMKK